MVVGCVHTKGAGGWHHGPYRDEHTQRPTKRGLLHTTNHHNDTSYHTKADIHY